MGNTFWEVKYIVWISRRGKDEGGLVQNDIFVLSDLDLMEKRQENGIVIGSS